MRPALLLALLLAFPTAASAQSGANERAASETNETAAGDAAATDAGSAPNRAASEPGASGAEGEPDEAPARQPASEPASETMANEAASDSPASQAASEPDSEPTSGTSGAPLTLDPPGVWPPDRPRPPIYEAWWLWTAIGVITLGVTLAIVIGVTTEHPKTVRASLDSAPSPAGLVLAFD